MLIKKFFTESSLCMIHSIRLLLFKLSEIFAGNDTMEVIYFMSQIKRF